MTDTTTDTETAPPVKIPADVAALFTETFADGYATDDLAKTLTCFETEAIAHMLAALDYKNDGDAWRAAHIRDCDSLDNHTN